MPRVSSRVRLRPHHFLCVHGFKGHGYSPAFVTNFWRVLDELAGEQAVVEAVAGTDDHICGPCPNNKGASCADEHKIRQLDDAYAATLGLKTGDAMSWPEARELVATRVSDDDFDRNCAPCSWRKLGVCKAALQKLRADAALGANGATRAIKSFAGFAIVSLALLGVSGARVSAAEKASAPAPSIPVSAAPAAPSGGSALAPGDSYDVPLFTTVEQLEQKLLADKSRRVPALYRVQHALNEQKWKLALDAAKPLEGRAEYSDYYHYLLGEAELGRMHSFQRRGAAATALVAAAQAKFHFTQVLAGNPYTTLWKRAGALLGQVELSMGEINIRLRHRAKAQQYLESGFQRLSQVNLLAMVSKATIVSYALICERNKTDMCKSWVTRLAPYVTKTEEARILERVAPFKRVYIERTNSSQSYKVDLDLQAFAKGFDSYLAGKFEDAYGTWRDLLRDYPRTNIKLRTKFWMARAAQRSKHDLQAQTLYREVIKELPFSYYALLSSWFGGIDLARMMDAELPVATAEAPNLTPSDLAHIKRAEMLIASAVPELAQLELADVRASSSMPNEFLVYLAMLNHLADNHQAAFQILSELSSRSFQGLFSSYGQKLYFPTERLPLVRSGAKEWKVDPLLVLSVVKQESAFNHEAVSVANAYGLMQLIPPTARDLDHSIELMDLFNPYVNVRLGSRYLRQLLNQYHGNIILALAAYNAGPGNANRWLRDAPKGLPPEEFIETITYKETREYVQSILRNYYWYSRRVKAEHAPSLMALTQRISPWKWANRKGASVKTTKR